MRFVRRPYMFVLLLAATTLPSGAVSQSFRQTQTDSYTRYELLAPETRSFRIIYDVTATTAGARLYFNAIRPGSDPTVHAVYDLMSGDSLPWEIVDGPVARERGMENASPQGQYIQVTLPRRVPEGGQVRLRIDKTYMDAESYSGSAEEVLFERTLGITRNAVVLPLGYELVHVNYPSQVRREPDGRMTISFMNRGPAGVPLVVRGRRLVSATSPSSTRNGDAPEPRVETTTVSAGARIDYQFTERAFQDRDIVYFLQQPETHAFRLYHDYTESRPGTDRYVNVVRAGSKASNPSATILDTGEQLVVETLVGDAIAAKNIDVEGITPATEVVVIWFDPVREGQSVRLRIEETYTDPNRYVLYGGELIWDRSFGRPRNTVILPDGWFLTTNAVPAVIDETDDGKIRLRYVNDRPGNIDVFIKARRRSR